MLKPEIGKTNDMIEALSFQMSKIEAGAVVTSKRSQEILESNQNILGGSKAIRLKLDDLTRTWNVSWGVIAVSSALLICFFFVGRMMGYRSGVDEGKWQIAHYWFDGFSNLDYWRQVRSGNRDQVKQCIDEGRSECTLRLP